MKKIDLSLESKNSQYQILIGNHLFQQPISILDDLSASKVAIVTNELVASHYLEALKTQLNFSNPSLELETILVGDGEDFKSIESFNLIIDRLVDKQFKRNDLIVALGGGVIGDLAGFSAACYQRGINIIQIPTTLLSMVDSSVGGKTAVNHPSGKNLIGAFHQPIQVRIDISSLHTLDIRQFNAGIAEVIKIAAIQDSKFFEWLEQKKTQIKELDSEVLQEMIYRSCCLKAQIVAADELEQGIRALLNFGHTFAHAIETLAGYGKVLHGEAVAIGMVLATRFAQMHCGFPPAVARRLIELLSFFGLPIALPKDLKSQELVETMLLDKKNRSDLVTLILPIQLGEAKVMQVNREEIEGFIKQYESH